MIVIGEKINASLKGVKEIIENRDAAGLLGLAKSQSEAGADILDVNVGTGMGSSGDEKESMQWAVRTIQAEVDRELCIDSADPAVLDAGLAVREGRPSLINSTKAKEETLAAIVPLAARYNAHLVGLAMDESGIPKTVEQRIAACDRIADAAKAHGVPIENLFFDPLVLPVSTDVNQGMVTLNTVAQIRKKYPSAKITMGLSNISYGLPGRARLNMAFLHMAVCAGLDSAIMDPLNKDMMDAVKTAEALVGRDRHCRRFARAFRK